MSLSKESETQPRRTDAILVLESVSQRFGTRTCVLHPGRYNIGSAADCEVLSNLPDVAARHCLILAGEGDTVVKAWQPHLWVNDREVTRETQLHPGDRLAVGSAVFRLRAARAEEVAPATRVDEESHVSVESVAQSVSLFHTESASMPIDADASTAAVSDRESSTVSHDWHETVRGPFNVDSLRDAVGRAADWVPVSHADSHADPNVDRLRDELERHLQGLRNDLDRQQDRVVQFLERHEATMDEAASRQRALDQADDRIRRADQRERLLNELLDAVQQQATDIQQRERDLHAAEREQGESLARRESRISIEAAYFKDRESRLTQLESELHRRESQLSESRDDLAAATRAAEQQRVANEQHFAAQEIRFRTSQTEFDARQQAIDQQAAQWNDAERDLQARIEQHKIECEQQQQELLQQKQTVDSRLAGLARWESELQTRSSELDARRQELDDHAERLDQSVAEDRERTTELDRRSQELDHRSGELKQQAHRIDARETELTARETHIGHEKSRLEQMAHDLDTRAVKLDERAAELDAEADEIECRRLATDDTSAVDDEIEARRQELADQYAEQCAREIELSNRTSQLEQLEDTLAEQRLELEQQSVEFDTQRASLDAARLDVERLTIQLDERAEQLDRHDRSRATTEDDVRNDLKQRLEEEHKAFESEIVGLRTSFAEKEAATDAEIRRLNDRIQELLDTSETATDELAAALDRREQELDQRAVELAEREAAHHSGSTEREASAEGKDSDGQVADWTAERDDLLRQRSDLAAELAQARESIKTLQASLEVDLEIEKHIEQMQEELTQRDQQIEELQQQLTADDRETSADTEPAARSLDFDQQHAELKRQQDELDQRTSRLDRRAEEISDREVTIERTCAQLEKVRDELKQARRELEQDRVRLGNAAGSLSNDQPREIDRFDGPQDSSGSSIEEDHGEAEEHLTTLRSELAEMFGIKPGSMSASKSVAHQSAPDDDDELDNAIEDDLEAAEKDDPPRFETSLAERPQGAFGGSSSNASSAPSPENHDYVQNYMEQLLARNRTGAHGAAPPPVSSAPARPTESATAGRKPPMTQTAGKHNQRPATTNPLLDISENEGVADAKPVERMRPIRQQDKDAIRANINSFRELANRSARQAITSHAVRRRRGELVFRSCLAAASFAAAALTAVGHHMGILHSIGFPIACLALGVISLLELFYASWNIRHQAASMVGGGRKKARPITEIAVTVGKRDGVADSGHPPLDVPTAARENIAEADTHAAGDSEPPAKTAGADEPLVRNPMME